MKAWEGGYLLAHPRIILLYLKVIGRPQGYTTQRFPHRHRIAMPTMMERRARIILRIMRVTALAQVMLCVLHLDRLLDQELVSSIIGAIESELLTRASQCDSFGPYEFLVVKIHRQRIGERLLGR
jgi:hypothetical protein